MASESEASILSRIAGDIHGTKQEIMFKKASCKVKYGIVQFYRHEIKQQRKLNIKTQYALLDLQTKSAQLRKHLAGLRSFNESMGNCKTEINKSFYEQKEKSKRYEEDSQNIIKIYTDKWTLRKNTYEGLPLAVERKVLKSQKKSYEFQLMLKTNAINYLVGVKNTYQKIQRQTKQNIIINFAGYMVRRVDIKRTIFALHKKEENILKNRELSDHSKMENKQQSGNFYQDSVRPLTNLPVKLNFCGYNLPEFEIPKQSTSIQIQSSKSQFSSLCKPIQIIAIKEALNNTRTEEMLHSSNPQKVNKKEDTEIELNKNLYTESNMLKNISKQSENSKESCLKDDKKIEILSSIVLKPEETSIILHNIKMNGQFNDNVVKLHSAIKIADSVSPSKNKSTEYSDNTKVYIEDHNLLKKIPQEIINNCETYDREVVVEQKAKKLKLDITTPIEMLVGKINDDSQESSGTICTPSTANSNLGTQEYDSNEAMRKKEYYEEKNILLRELKAKYYNRKSSQVTPCEQNVNLKQQVSIPPLSPSVSKFFSKNENLKIDNKNAVDEEAIEFSNKEEVTNKQSTIWTSTEKEEKQTNLVFNKIDHPATQANEFHKTFLAKAGAETIFETQNTFMNTYASSIASLDYSEYEDDSSIMNTGTESKATLENIVNLEQKDEHAGKESNKFLFGNGLGSFAKTSFNFFGDGNNAEAEKYQDKDPEPKSSAFNVLFGISDEKKDKGNFFDFLK